MPSSERGLVIVACIAAPAGLFLQRRCHSSVSRRYPKQFVARRTCRGHVGATFSFRGAAEISGRDLQLDTRVIAIALIV